MTKVIARLYVGTPPSPQKGAEHAPLVHGSLRVSAGSAAAR
jgi:hypothetical protein